MPWLWCCCSRWLFLFFFVFWLHFRPPKHCLIPLFEQQFFIQTTVERRKEKVHFIGDLGPSKWEFWRYLSGHLFLAELSPCRKCHGIYRRRERSRSREVCQPSLLFSLLLSGWKTVAQIEVLNSAQEVWSAVRMERKTRKVSCLAFTSFSVYTVRLACQSRS